MKLAEGHTFAEISDKNSKLLADQSKLEIKKMEAQEHKAKKEWMNLFIQKNKAFVQNIDLKFAP